MSATHEDVLKVVLNNLKCSICLELFEEPVTLACGHNYCRRCIHRHLDRGKRDCPDCRYQLPAQPTLKKNVTLFKILDLQEAGGRETWNQLGVTDQWCSSVQRETMSREALERRLELLKMEIKTLEMLLSERDPQDDSTVMNEDVQAAEGFSSSLDSGYGAAGSSSSSLPSEPEDSPSQSEGALPDPEEVTEVLREDTDPLAGLTRACGLSGSAAVGLMLSEPAEFVVLSFRPALGHRRLAFVPERRKLQVRPARSSMSQNSRFEACQCMADQQFSSGRYYWDVDVTLCSGWAAGVAYPDLGRNEQLGRSSSSWCIERSSSRLSAWHNSTETLLKQSCPESIRVLLDMDSRRLSFWGLKEGLDELYSVQADFSGPVRPVFWLLGTKQMNALTFPGPNM